ncbi:MAG: hypothetical protein M3N52_09175 [Actinomycetota bacterium]|nr:hypothetical protein [Actinomycetota bacterium]
MTTIKATCPICGEVGLGPEEIELRVDATGGESFYSFTCPSCLGVVRKPADQRVIRLLISGGVEVLEHEHEDPTHAAPPPGEGGGAAGRESNQGPAITHDDLLDFHVLLRSDGWFDELVQLVRTEHVR